jgi:hypothetical protein
MAISTENGILVLVYLLSQLHGNIYENYEANRCILLMKVI